MPLFDTRRRSFIVASSGVAAPITGTTDETALATIAVPAGLLKANDKFRITTLWSHTNSGNAKTLRVRYTGILGTAYMGPAPTATALSQWITTIHANNATNAQKGFSAVSNPYSASTSALVTSSVDTTAATSIVISGQLANTGETITLEGYTVEYVPGV
jgi:hypothetical protein